MEHPFDSIVHLIVLCFVHSPFWSYSQSRIRACAKLCLPRNRFQVAASTDAKLRKLPRAVLSRQSTLPGDAFGRLAA
jgi:hypothetical protein